MSATDDDEQSRAARKAWRLANGTPGRGLRVTLNEIKDFRPSAYLKKGIAAAPPTPNFFKIKSEPDGSPFFEVLTEEQRQAATQRLLNQTPASTSRPPPPHAEAQRLAREDGVCDAIVQKYGNRETEIPEHVCRGRVRARGKCHDHYLRDCLFIEPNGKIPGKGGARRPFYKWQLPVGYLSQKQEAMLANPKRLPVATSLEDCIARLNEIDPTNPLRANDRNPNERKFRSRKPPKPRPSSQ